MSEATKTEIVETESSEGIAEKPYTLREIEADDIDYLVGIIDKIGLEKVAECIDKKAIASMIEGKKVDDNLKNEVGISVMAKIAAIIVKNYRVAKGDVYALLASMSGMTVDEIAHLKLPVYVQMIIDVFKQDGFIESFKVASSLLK